MSKIKAHAEVVVDTAWTQSGKLAHVVIAGSVEIGDEIERQFRLSDGTHPLRRARVESLGKAYAANGRRYGRPEHGLSLQYAYLSEWR